MIRRRRQLPVTSPSSAFCLGNYLQYLSILCSMQYIYLSLLSLYILCLSIYSIYPSLCFSIYCTMYMSINTVFTMSFYLLHLYLQRISIFNCYIYMYIQLNLSIVYNIKMLRYTFRYNIYTLYIVGHNGS